MKISTFNQRLLDLIKENIKTEDICQQLNINKEQLKNRLFALKRSGFNIQREFFYDGTQRYILSKKPPTSPVRIYDVQENLFRALAISDLHIGSKFDNLSYLEMAYEYCLQNDIHIIINGGDLIQGTLGPRRFSKLEEQILFLLENYPYDEQILNFIVLGNHDADLISVIGMDLHTILTENRLDLISLGYGVQKLAIGEENITLAHTALDLRNVYGRLKITGHGHRFQFKVKHNEPSLFLPTLSDDVKDGFLPGMVEIDLLLKEGCFRKGVFRHFVIQGNKFVPASNIVFSFPDTTQKVYQHKT